MGKVGEYGVVYIDPIGAIIISIYILVNWWKTGYGRLKVYSLVFHFEIIIKE